MPPSPSRTRAATLACCLALALTLCVGCTTTRRGWLPAQWESLDAEARGVGVQVARGQEATVHLLDGRERRDDVLAVGRDYLVLGGASNYGLQADTLRLADIAAISVRDLNALGRVGSTTVLVLAALFVAVAIGLSQTDLSGLS